MAAKTFFGEYQADPRLLDDARFRGVANRVTALEAADVALDARVDTLEATDVAYDARLDTLEALPRGVEVWSSATLPTTNNFAGRCIFATGLANANFNLSLLVHNGFFWRMAGQRTFSHDLTSGNVTTNGSQVLTTGVSLGALPANLEVSCRIAIEGNGTYATAHRWNIKNVWNGNTHYQGICGVTGTHRHHMRSYLPHTTNLSGGTTLSWQYLMQSDGGANSTWVGVGTFAEQWQMQVEVS